MKSVILLKRRTSRIVLAWISLALLLILVAPVSAHGYIVRSIPEDRAVLKRSPARLQYWFSEDLEPEFTKIIVRDQTGQEIVEGGVDPQNLSLLSVRLPPDLPNGAYTAELRTAFASDGHVIVETRVFFVGEGDTGVTGQTSGDQAVPLEVVWRVLVLSSSLLLLGAFGVYAMVLVPAWGSRKYRGGLLPPRVMKRLNWIVGIALAVDLIGNIIALLQQTMVFFNADLGRVLDQQLWSIVRIGSQFGDMWNYRMMLLILIALMFAASIYLREGQPETVRAFWVANEWATMLMFATFSLSSHAAGSLIQPWIALANDWIHQIAVGFWAGGVVALTLVLPVALQPYQGEARRQALLAALKRFTRVAAAGLVVVIATGIYSASNWFSTPADFLTSYGGALGLKVLLVGLLVAVGAAHHIALQPKRYARWSAVIKRVNNFLPTLRLESLLVLAVLASVAYLSATPIPQPKLVGQTEPPPSGTQTVNGYTVTTTITPGGPGVNTYDVQIERDGKAVDGLKAALRTSDPSRDLRGDWHDLEGLDGGLYAVAGDEINQPGQWWTVVRIDDQTGTTQIAYQWQITDAASVIESRPMTPVNWLALAGVLAALLFAAWPTLLRFYHSLDLSPKIVLVGAGALALSIAAFVIGIQQAQIATDQFNQRISPPPQIVNVVLPSQTSLTQGHALFEQSCAAWTSNTDFQQLILRLGRTRDEDLYAAVSAKGWWSLPPCQGDHPPEDWWNVVNYLRSLESVSG